LYKWRNIILNILRRFFALEVAGGRGKEIFTAQGGNRIEN
jgi:hypothetical protein